jgi:hypothetical protein
MKIVPLVFCGGIQRSFNSFGRTGRLSRSLKEIRLPWGWSLVDHFYQICGKNIFLIKPDLSGLQFSAGRIHVQQFDLFVPKRNSLLSTGSGFSLELRSACPRYFVVIPCTSNPCGWFCWSHKFHIYALHLPNPFSIWHIYRTDGQSRPGSNFIFAQDSLCI